MLSSLLATLGLLFWAVPILAQDQSGNCPFVLTSDDSMLGQLPGGQVLGISTTQNTSVELGGTLFHIQEGRLYDSAMRGCWWVAPTTVLVCNLLAPTLSDPLFTLNEEARLVYNNSQSDFWECPVDLGSEGQGVQGSTSYYLDLPADMAVGGGCRRVKVEAVLFGGWFCEGEGEGNWDSSSSSLADEEATLTVSWTELSVSESWIAATETTSRTVDTAPMTVSQPGAVTTFTTVTIWTGSGVSTTEAVS